MLKHFIISVAAFCVAGCAHSNQSTANLDQVEGTPKSVVCGEFALPSHENFRCLIEKRVSASEVETKSIDTEIARYKKSGSPFVLDLSKFSAKTRDHGIATALASTEDAWVVINPIIGKFGGEVLKFEGDTMFAFFPDVKTAIEASIEIENIAAKKAKSIMASGRSDKLPNCTSIGIGFGEEFDWQDKKDTRTLVIPGHDAYGVEVNNAFGAGEITASYFDITLTDAAYQNIKSSLPSGIAGVDEIDCGKFYSIWRLKRADGLSCPVPGEDREPISELYCPDSTKPRNP